MRRTHTVGPVCRRQPAVVLCQIMGEYVISLTRLRGRHGWHTIRRKASIKVHEEQEVSFYLIMFKQQMHGKKFGEVIHIFKKGPGSISTSGPLRGDLKDIFVLVTCQRMPSLFSYIYILVWCLIMNKLNNNPPNFELKELVHLWTGSRSVSSPPTVTSQDPLRQPSFERWPPT